MRKSLLTALSALCFAFAAKAQTTQTEYDYITKGYRTVEEAGMDVKNGYETRDVTSASTEVSDGKVTIKRTARLLAFYRKTNGQTPRKIAAYILTYQRDGLPKEYLCVPSPYSPQNITQQFSYALYNADGDQSYRLQTISLLLARGLTWFE